jgi:extracellular matrix protein 14
MLVSSIGTLLLFAATLSPAIAVPTDTPDPFQPLPINSISVSHRPQNVRGSFTRLRDSLIQRIWGAPQRHENHADCTHRRPKFSAPLNFRTRYNGDVVLRFKIKSEEDAKALVEVSDILYLDVWESTNEWVDIRLAKDVVPSVLSLLPPPLKITYTPLMHDLAQTVYESYPSHAPNHDQPSHRGFTSSLHGPTAQSGESRELFFQEYQPLSVIQPWMRLMASLFPSHVSKFSIGLSYQGRDIPALRIGVHPTNNDQPLPPRKTILITGGSHAREWISTTTVNYIAYSLITRYGRFAAVTKLLEEFDFVFIPTLNPDGYVYTWDTDRLWRKNRQETDLRFCHGIDLDRAFGFAWDGESARSNPCSENYAGGGPFEGTEAKRLADWARNETENNNVTLVAFLDLHSYSQQVLYPYSYSCALTPPSLEDLEEMAMGVAKAFRLTYGHFYGVSSACEANTLASCNNEKSVRAKMELGGGSALDWFYHELGVKHTLQIKLRDTGSYGFLLPKAHIVPTGQETFNAVLALGKYLMGDKGIELNWEKEFIAAPNVAEEFNQREDTEPPFTDHEAEIPIKESEEEEEDDWSMELRRRRRR